MNKQLNRFGRLRLTHLENQRQGLLKHMEEEGLLEAHLLAVQRRAYMEYEQLLMAGMEEQAAEAFIIRDILQE